MHVCVYVCMQWWQSLHEGPKETTPDVGPDTQALDAVFTDAVLTVRRIRGP